jgi:hypothetical protein
VSSGPPGSSTQVLLCPNEEDKCRLCKKPPRQRRFLGGFQTANIWQYLLIETSSTILRN